jgi:hypothetical protein
MRQMLVIPIILAIFGDIAAAQSNDSPMARMRRGYNDCVMASALAQIKQTGPNSDLNMVMELAFQACQTEERAIRIVLATYDIPAGQREAAILKVKLELKAFLRQIAANPQQYR